MQVGRERPVGVKQFVGTGEKQGVGSGLAVKEPIEVFVKFEDPNIDFQPDRLPVTRNRFEQFTVLEPARSDGLLGTGLVGGIMRNNGRQTATEEMIALGCGQLFHVCDSVARHSNFKFPGHKHAALYDVAKIEPAVRRCLLEHGIEIWLFSRVTGIDRSNGSIAGIKLESGATVEGEVFVDATGTVGAQSFCTDHGNGCVMCIVRCPTFGPRVSLTALAGIAEKQGKRKDGSIGAVSGSCKLIKDTIAPHIVDELDRTGKAIIPMPEHLIHTNKLGAKACQQYALKEYAENVILLDTGQVKLMTSFVPLHELRQVPGLEEVRYEDPYSGTVGNSIRYTALSPRDDAMQVQGGVDNLFCGGEKAGLLVGHTEAMVTGALGGHNAVRAMAGRETLVLPDTLAVGDAITNVRESMDTEEGLMQKYTFSGSVYFQRMKAKGLYSTDNSEIAKRVADADLTNVFQQPVV